MRRPPAAPGGCRSYGVTATSRLSCQIALTEEMDGLTVRIPPEARDMSGV